MAMKLHWSPDSANLPVRIALERLGLAFEGVRVNRQAREQDGAAYRKINPQGLIPALEDDAVVLFEAGAILLHVAERAGRFGPNGPLVEDPDARARALSWLFYLSNTVHADLRCAFYPHRIMPGHEPILVAGIRRRFAGHCDLLEGVLAGGTFFAAGASILEDYLGACLRWAQLYPGTYGPVLESLDCWPGLAALMAEHEVDPALRRAMAAEAINGSQPITRPALPELPEAEVTG
ncbi:MAG: glutathione S-transferase family protein [Pikeienuella sp.]